MLIFGGCILNLEIRLEASKQRQPPPPPSTPTRYVVVEEVDGELNEIKAKVMIPTVGGRNPKQPAKGCIKSCNIMGQSTNLNWLAGLLPSTVSSRGFFLLPKVGKFDPI